MRLHGWISMFWFSVANVDVIYLTTDVKIFINDENDRRDDNNVRLLFPFQSFDNRDLIVFPYRRSYFKQSGTNLFETKESRDGWSGLSFSSGKNELMTHNHMRQLI